MSNSILSCYRPWHDSQRQLLIGASQERGLHHALLLQGPRAMGKRHFARGLSHFLLCSNRELESLSACGHCASCELLAAGTHPDLHRLSPEGSKQIGVDAVRLLRDRLVQTPQVGNSKVCLIEPADALNENSASALLKLLEEPPESTYFLLVADNPQYLLPTIKSRCMSLAFCLPDSEKLKSYLMAVADDVALVDEAIQSSRGFPEKAIRLLDPTACSSSEGADDAASADGVSGTDRVLEAASEAVDSWFAKRRLSEARILELSKLPLEPLLDALVEAVNLRLVGGLYAEIAPGELDASYRRLIEARRTVSRNPNARLLLQSLNIDFAG